MPWVCVPHDPRFASLMCPPRWAHAPTHRDPLLCQCGASSSRAHSPARAQWPLCASLSLLPLPLRGAGTLLLRVSVPHCPPTTRASRERARMQEGPGASQTVSAALAPAAGGECAQVFARQLGRTAVAGAAAGGKMVVLAPQGQQPLPAFPRRPARRRDAPNTGTARRGRGDNLAHCGSTWIQPHLTPAPFFPVF